jgi:hypothetical protein
MNSFVKKILLSLWCLSAFNLGYAQESQKKIVLSLGDKQYEFSELKDGGYIDSKCLNEKKNCEALKALKKLSYKNLPKDWSKGGVNPGSALCRYSVKGKVIIAFDEKGNQNSICIFDDGSFVTNGTLALYAK